MSSSLAISLPAFARLQLGTEAEDVVVHGEAALADGYLKNTGSPAVYDFLEKLGTAAAMTGRVELAEVCLARLIPQFPTATRVSVLEGMIMEAKGDQDGALRYYEGLLALDEGNVLIRKRLISLHLYATAPVASNAVAVEGKGKAAQTSTTEPEGPSPETGLRMLLEYLDTVYNDAEGWAQLAAVYLSMGLPGQALVSLAHLILLAPQNPFYLLRHAEVAHTLADYGTAWKEALRVVEMCEGTVGSPVALRGAMLAQSCLVHLRQSTLGTGLQLDRMELLLTKMIVQGGGSVESTSAPLVR